MLVFRSSVIVAFTVKLSVAEYRDPISTLTGVKLVAQLTEKLLLDDLKKFVGCVVKASPDLVPLSAGSATGRAAAGSAVLF